MQLSHSTHLSIPTQLDQFLLENPVVLEALQHQLALLDLEYLLVLVVLATPVDPLDLVYLVVLVVLVTPVLHDSVELKYSYF